MKIKLLSRTCISPIICITFLVVVITGLLLAFHIRVGGVKVLHEWIGYVFMVVGFFHILLNLKTFATYFRERTAMLAALAVIIMSIAVFWSGEKGDEGRRHGGPPLLRTFDTNGDGIIDAYELANAATSLGKLDTDHDGVISRGELMSGKGRGFAHYK